MGFLDRIRGRLSDLEGVQTRGMAALVPVREVGPVTGAVDAPFMESPWAGAFLLLGIGASVIAAAIQRAIPDSKVLASPVVRELVDRGATSKRVDDFARAITFAATEGNPATADALAEQIVGRLVASGDRKRASELLMVHFHDRALKIATSKMARTSDLAGEVVQEALAFGVMEKLISGKGQGVPLRDLVFNEIRNEAATRTKQEIRATRGPEYEPEEIKKLKKEIRSAREILESIGQGAERDALIAAIEEKSAIVKEYNRTKAFVSAQPAVKPEIAYVEEAPDEGPSPEETMSRTGIVNLATSAERPEILELAASHMLLEKNRKSGEVDAETNMRLAKDLMEQEAQFAASIKARTGMTLTRKELDEAITRAKGAIKKMRVEPAQVSARTVEIQLEYDREVARVRERVKQAIEKNDIDRAMELNAQMERLIAMAPTTKMAKKGASITELRAAVERAKIDAQRKAGTVWLPKAAAIPGAMRAVEGAAKKPLAIAMLEEFGIPLPKREVTDVELPQIKNLRARVAAAERAVRQAEEPLREIDAKFAEFRARNKRDPYKEPINASPSEKRRATIEGRIYIQQKAAENNYKKAVAAYESLARALKAHT